MRFYYEKNPNIIHDGDEDKIEIKEYPSGKINGLQIFNCILSLFGTIFGSVCFIYGIILVCCSKKHIKSAPHIPTDQMKYGVFQDSNQNNNPQQNLAHVDIETQK